MVLAKHKRKPAQTARRGPTRAPYDKVLIVCEGEKTEPNYFRGLIKWYDISSVNVRISGDCGAAPISVVQHGIELYASEQGEPYDRVYFVFDRDSYHLPSQNKVYQQALEQIRQGPVDNVFFAANSILCFEYWLLLHFCETTQAFAAQGKASVGDMVGKELKKYWREYGKGLPDAYVELRKLAPQGEAQALDRAQRVLRTAQAIGEENPSTMVHELVAYLITIKDSPKG
jgi:RloB-like protein